MAADAPVIEAPAGATPEIKVSSITPTSTPTAPAKPGSARERMAKEMQSFADKKAAASTPLEPAAKTPSGTPNASAPTKEPSSSPTEAPIPGAEPTKEQKDGKVNPWELLKKERESLKKYQSEITELNKRAVSESDWKNYQEKQSSLEKRNKELEDEIRYVNYSKSGEFQEKYEKPYQDAWKRAMDELGELTMDDGSGNARALSAKDILSLVNMPLQKAREAAEQAFGPLANDVMQHRNEIRRLFNEQSNALQKAREEGEGRQKQQQEQSQRQQKELEETVKQTWSQANEALMKDSKHSKYFTPIEGDQEGNQRLGKGFELADRAFSENPFAPGLTPEQRKSIVERHAAVRNRCAAYGRLTYQLEKSNSRIAELEAQLKAYKDAEPGTVDQTSKRTEQPNGSPAMSARERMFGELQKIGKPI